MALVLKQVRPCDGECCKESPRFPVDPAKLGKERGGCVYFDDTVDNNVPGGGRFCQLMADPSRQDDLGRDGKAENWSGLSDFEYFKQTCVAWPQKGSTPAPDETAGCCWQWVEDGA